MTKFLQPKYFFFGIIFGFLLCCILGHIISKQARFTHFDRFFAAISPQMQYYPTSHELLATAKHYVPPDKVLVLVGGSSIFRGTGQNPEEVWTKELQKKLGNQFYVLNYGIDGGGLSSFGATAFKILNERYAKIIFVSTCTAGGAGAPDGEPPFDYLFWDAYYKHLYHPDTVELQLIRNMRIDQLKTANGIEKQLLSYLDSILYFKNLWNWVGYRVGFTVWTNNSATSLFRPRRRYIEESVDLKTIREIQWKELSRAQAETNLFGKMVESLIDLSKKQPEMFSAKDDQITKNYAEVFSPKYRSKILCVIISENPKRISALPKRIQEAHEIMLKKTRSQVESLGYNAIDIGQDFSPEDYFDGGHLFVSGGKKVAALVAKKVQTIAIKNGYIN